VTQFIKDNDTGIVYTPTFSIDHPDFPEKKEPVRASILLGGWILIPTKTGCSTVYCAEINPNGNIPKSLIKFSADLQGKIVSNLKTYMINKWQKRGGKIFDFENGEGLIVGVTLEDRKRAKEKPAVKLEIKEEIKEVIK